MKKQTTNELILLRVTELLETVREFREIIPLTVPAKTKDPQHVGMYWVMDYLGIKRTTFYMRVRNQLLYPVMRIGNREYYDREEVLALARRQSGEGGRALPQRHAA